VPTFEQAPCDLVIGNHDPQVAQKPSHVAVYVYLNTPRVKKSLCPS